MARSLMGAQSSSNAKMNSVRHMDARIYRVYSLYVHRGDEIRDLRGNALMRFPFKTHRGIIGVGEGTLKGACHRNFS